MSRLKTLEKYAAIKTDILTALKGSSSQQPVAVELLAQRLVAHTLHDIETVLHELYSANQVSWCKIIKHAKKDMPTESVVWWLLGTVAYAGEFGRTGRTYGS